MHSMHWEGWCLANNAKVCCLYFLEGDQHDSQWTEACWNQTWGRQQLTTYAEIPQVQPLLWNYQCPWSLYSGPVMTVAVLIITSWGILPFSWRIAPGSCWDGWFILIKQWIDQTLTVLSFCNMVRLRIFQIFKSVFFSLRILSLKHFPLLSFYYKQSGEANL